VPSLPRAKIGSDVQTVYRPGQSKRAAEMKRATKKTPVLDNRYELSTEAFKRIYGRRPTLNDKDHFWILGWQHGFAEARRYAHSASTEQKS